MDSLQAMKKPDQKSKLDVTALVTQYGDALFRFAYLRTGQRELAEDLVQETFLTAHTKSETYRGEGSVLSWLQTILKNKLIDLVRTRSYSETSVEAPDFFSEWGVWKEPFSKWFEWQDSPEQSLERRDFFTTLNECLGKLPLKQRLIIGLRAFDELPTEAICKELDISTSNQWVLTYRARLGLRECLEKNWYNKE